VVVSEKFNTYITTTTTKERPKEWTPSGNQVRTASMTSAISCETPALRVFARAWKNALSSSGSVWLRYLRALPAIPDDGVC